MTDAFSASVQSWQGFYAAVAQATAALLGLLFVAVSIRLASVTAAERLELRGRVATVFSNLVSALVLSLVMLIPSQTAGSVAAEIGIVTILSAVRVVRRIWQLLSAKPRPRIELTTWRRLGWTLFAIGTLGYTVAGLWLDGGAGYLYALLTAVFIYLVGAADVSWDLLLQETGA
jgi:hypothetical protein